MKKIAYIAILSLVFLARPAFASNITFTENGGAIDIDHSSIPNGTLYRDILSSTSTLWAYESNQNHGTEQIWTAAPMPPYDGIWTYRECYPPISNLTLPNNDPSCIGFWNLTITGGHLTLVTVSDGTGTRIISTTPISGTTVATSSSTSIGATGYVNPNDWTNGDYIEINYRRDADAIGVCQQAGLQAINCIHGTTIQFPNPTAGYWSYASSTLLDPRGGIYDIKTSIIHPRWYWFNQTLTSTSTWFTYGGQVGYDQIGPHATSSNPASVGFATSTQAIAEACTIISLNFRAGDCLYALFIPTPQMLSDLIDTSKQAIATKFPIGYIYDFITIFASSTPSSIPIIDATVPNGIIGTGAHIKLDLTHSLDYILNATTSKYLNSSASSTQTFFQITDYYWRLFLYAMLGIYIIYRILGSHLKPPPNTK